MWQVKLVEGNNLPKADGQYMYVNSVERRRTQERQLLVTEDSMSHEVLFSIDVPVH